MLRAAGEHASNFFRTVVPDPLILAMLLTGVVFLAAILGTDADPRTLIESWQAGFWNLLTFAMQMCLILVTGHALASSRPVAGSIARIASIPRSARQGVVLTAAIAMAAGLVNWGFGLIVGAILAREVGRSLASRGVRAPMGLLAAAGYTAMLVWHGGLSGSAPLKAASEGGQTEVLGADLAAEIGPIPIGESLLSSFNILVTGGAVALTLAALALMCPKPGELNPAAPEPETEAEPDQPSDTETGALNRALSIASVWVVAVPALLWLAWQTQQRGFEAVSLNSVNLLFLSLGLLLHGSANSYGNAVTRAAGACGGIIVQFPLYAGIMGMMTLASLPAGAALRDQALAPTLSRGFANAAGDDGGALRALTFLSAGLVNLFVPSGGGQWAVQGPIAMRATLEAGAPAARTLMAVAYGDQLTNMLQPFWALPLLAITKAKAGEVVGYTAIVMLIAGAWMLACLWIL